MAGAVKHTRLESRSARARLKRGRQPHWQAVVPGRVHLGYQRWKGDADGRWVLRRYSGQHTSRSGKIVAKYLSQTLGRADDDTAADGENVLSFEQAEAKARAIVDAPGGGKVHRLTVRQAMEQYVEYKRSTGQSVADVISRGTAHILPPLGDLVVSELTAEKLRRWLAAMAAAPAQVRPKAGNVQYQAKPNGEEAVRRRRASANRVLTMLKAILNHAFDEGNVSVRDAWGRKLKPFRNVEVARVRYLSIAEAQRLINACDPNFRPLLRAALETGCRYSELARLEVADFIGDAGAIAVRQSKSGKPRHVVLTDEGVKFFREHCAGRAGHELMFVNQGRVAGALQRERDRLKKAGEDPSNAKIDDRGEWKASEQGRPMNAANTHAQLTPAITFHGLRHTWASHAVMNGVPLLVVAKNLGHADTRMVERVYGHLAPSFVVDAIRSGAPRYGIKPGKVVVPLV